jgi:YaiO family outer membrane protein
VTTLRKIILPLMAILSTLILTVSGVVAQEIKDRPRRIEASFSFENLSPHGIYGDWNTGNLSFYNKVSPDLTYFVQGAFFNRNEGNGAVGTVGAYKGWTSFLYTCTSVTAGTHSTYLPEFRFDHDFNFSVWPSKNINFLTGMSYIRYFDDHRTTIFSGGPMIYLDKWILHYRLFYNMSYPGDMNSFSHLISVGYGQEGWQWTYLEVSFGKQAYLATYLATPQEVNQSSLSVTLRHRHWLGKHYGIFGDASYFKLTDGYEKYGMALGAFYEF